MICPRNAIGVHQVAPQDRPNPEEREESGGDRGALVPLRRAALVAEVDEGSREAGQTLEGALLLAPSQTFPGNRGSGTDGSAFR